MSGENIIFIGVGMLVAAILLTSAAIWKGKKEKKKLEEYIKRWY